MKVYAESNFVLEQALLQEQHESCAEILQLCESGALRLAIPAFSLVEPYWTLTKNHRRRKEIKTKLDMEIQQISRTAAYSAQWGGLGSLAALLVDSANDEITGLEQVRDRLLRSAEIISLDKHVLEAAAHFQREHDLSAQDAVVYASVHSDLDRSAPADSCFLNRNSRDFDDPDIVSALAQKNCKLFPRFDSAHRYIRKFFGSAEVAVSDGTAAPG